MRTYFELTELTQREQHYKKEKKVLTESQTHLEARTFNKPISIEEQLNERCDGRLKYLKTIKFNNQSTKTFKF